MIGGGSVWLIPLLWVLATWCLSPLVRHGSVLACSGGLVGLALLAPAARLAISYLRHGEPWYYGGTLRFASFEAGWIAVLLGLVVLLRIGFGPKRDVS